MQENQVRKWAILLPALFLAACGQPEPANISEDQMNHFSGIAEHDHPLPPSSNSSGVSQKNQPR